MIVFGRRVIERKEIIVEDGEEKKVSAWFKRTGFVPASVKPVQRVLYVHAKQGVFSGRKVRPKRVSSPFQIVKGMRLFVVERPVRKRKS